MFSRGLSKWRKWNSQPQGSPKGGSPHGWGVPCLFGEEMAKIGVQPKERAASGDKHKYARPVDRLDWLDGAGFDWRSSSRRAIYFTKHLCTQILFCHSEAFNSLFLFFLLWAWFSCVPENHARFWVRVSNDTQGLPLNMRHHRGISGSHDSPDQQQPE